MRSASYLESVSENFDRVATLLEPVSYTHLTQPTSDLE